MPPRPTRHASGFTLVELVMVVSIIAVIAVIAIPNLLAARLNANEASAISTLRNVWTGASQFQATGRVDVDGDGTGEYGFFREMSGALGVRTAADGSTVGPPAQPAAVSSTFRRIDAAGGSERSGYRYQVLLPDSTGVAVRETPTGSFTGTVDPDLAETTFAVYAWPAGFATTGNRTFFVNQGGDTTHTSDDRYSGTNMYTLSFAGAAFLPAGGLTTITGRVAVGTLGRDGNIWRKVD